MPVPLKNPAPVRWLVALTFVVFGLSLGAAPANATAPEESAVIGTLEYGRGKDKNAVEGVTLTVTTADGVEVGSATSGADGTWSVPVPDIGKYIVTLDEATLPDGVALSGQTAPPATISEGADPLAPNQRLADVRAPGERSVVFGLTDGSTGAARANDTVLAAQLFVDGLKLGLIIAMCSIGLSLIYGTTGLVNFAHGEIVTFGAMIAYLFSNVLGIQLIFAALITIVIGGFAGGLFNELVWRPLRRSGASLIAALVVSIGFSILFRASFTYVFGGRNATYSDYQVQKKIYFFGLFGIEPKEIVVMALSVFVLVAVAIGLERTKLGKAMRAVADNRDLAESSGIDVDNVIRMVWIIGAALAALGGVFFGLIENINFDMGFRLLLLMFAGITLGGLGTAYGAFLGSLLIGILINMSTLSMGPVPGVPSELKNVGALLVLILILLLRPQGLLGRAERVG